MFLKCTIEISDKALNTATVQGKKETDESRDVVRTIFLYCGLWPGSQIMEGKGTEGKRKVSIIHFKLKRKET
jgi:hypothetical protein